MTDTLTRTITVPEISCDHCKAAIEGAVGGLDGVQSASVDVESKTVTVVGGTVDDIVEAIDDAGYDVDRDSITGS